MAGLTVPDNYWGIWDGGWKAKKFEQDGILIDDIYIKVDGTSTTTAEIPFAEGMFVPDNKKITLGNSDDSEIYYASTGTLNIKTNLGDITITSTGNFSWIGDVFAFQESAGGDVTLNFLGGTNDGVLKWMEDEDYFQFSDDILLPDNEKLIFGTGADVTILYNGTDLVINPKAVGSGVVLFDTDSKLAFRTTATTIHSSSTGILEYTATGLGATHKWLIGSVELFRAAGTFVVNETANSLVDFRAESVNFTHMLFLDSSADVIGINTSTPDTDAVMDFGGIKPVILPKLTTTQRDAVSAASGMIIFNTTTSAFNGYDGTNWIAL